MPTFHTPGPVTLSLEFELGAARIAAAERTDTVITVEPSDPGQAADVRAAEETTIALNGATLTVRGPRKRSLFGHGGSIIVTIGLPAHSTVAATAPMADLTCTGPLRDCRLKTSAGNLQVDRATNAWLKTSFGDIHLGHADGDADLGAVGRIHAGTVTGAATLKNANGPIDIEHVGGDLRASTSNGPISIGVADARVDAKSANGAIRIGQVRRGRIALHTAAGQLEVGIAPATAAWLDLDTHFGAVRNILTATDAPSVGEESVEVRARTGFGDILVHHA